MSEMGNLERRYRRLLAVFPVDHRRAHGEEMLGVLLAGARDGQRSPRLAEAADLVLGALRIRARRLARGSADQRWRDALAVLSVVMPLLMLAVGLATNDILGVAIRAVNGAPENPFWLLYWTVWPTTLGAAVLVLLVLLRLRRVAAFAAFALTIAGAMVRVWGPPLYLDSALAAMWLCMGGLATSALVFSPGPKRGLAILRWWRTGLIGASALVFGALAWGDPFSIPGFRLLIWGNPTFAVPAVGSNLRMIVILAAPVAAAAVCLWTSVGRRVLAMLAIPAIPFGYYALAMAAGIFPAPLPDVPQPVMLYLPPLIVLALVAAAARRDRHRAVRGGGGSPTGQDAET